MVNDSDIANAAMTKLAEQLGDSTYADMRPFQIAFCNPLAFVKIYHGEDKHVYTIEINTDELEGEQDIDTAAFDRFEAAQLERLDAMRQGDFDERPHWT